MPALYIVTLELERPPERGPEPLHRLVSSWLDRGIEHIRLAKPWTITPLSRVSEVLYEFGIAGLSAEAEERIRDAIRRAGGSGIRLGSVDGEIVNAEAGAEPVESASWSDLMDRSTQARRFQFDFLSPTTFRTGATTIPLPHPNHVFGSYRSRWNWFAPEAARPVVAFQRVVFRIARHEIKTTPQLRFRRAGYVGFTGRVVIEADTEGPVDARALDALAAIAIYSGTGAGTTFGMGVTRYRRLQ